MALEFDKDSSDAAPVRDIDNFQEKYRSSQARREEMFSRFRSFVSHNLGSMRDTTIVHLMLKHEIIFSDEQMMMILNLDPNVLVQRAIFDKFRAVVRHCAITLRTKVPASRLLDMPLTDISRICYRIAERFESLFCIPVSRVASRQFYWNDRFNGMWPIVCELNKMFITCGVTLLEDAPLEMQVD